MHCHWSLPPLALLAGCTSGGAANNSADLNAAATRAERDVAGYAAARPGATQVTAMDMPTTVSARYHCVGAPDLTVEFDNVAQTARVWLDGGGSMTLRQRPAASGIRYAGEGYALFGKGMDAEFDAPGRPAVRCRAIQ